jgi:hypothetical protein
MRKKADPRTPKHPKPSRAGANNNGLIVKEQSDSPRSDRETCALDDRSHGTPSGRLDEKADLTAQRSHYLGGYAPWWCEPGFLSKLGLLIEGAQGRH